MNVSDEKWWITVAALAVALPVLGRRRIDAGKLWPLAVLFVAIVLYRYSLRRTLGCGNDFPVYYAAGQGRMVWGNGEGYYVYSERLLPAFAWMRRLTYQQAFTVSYVASVVSFWLLMRRLFRCFSAYPVTVCVAAVVAGVAWIDVLRLQNIGGLLAFACLSPVGSLLAGCVKPYLLGFVVVHAAIACHRRRRCEGAAVEAELLVFSRSIGDSGAAKG